MNLSLMAHLLHSQPASQPASLYCFTNLDFPYLTNRNQTLNLIWAPNFFVKIFKFNFPAGNLLTKRSVDGIIDPIFQKRDGVFCF